MRSALAGTVTYAGMLAGRGVVVVSHGATRTTYEPVTATVGVGQPVAAGGALGAPGAARLALLPARLPALGLDRRATTYLDPLRLVGLGPVRLLPLWRDEPVEPRPCRSAQARGWAWRYAARSRSVVTCV